MKNVKSVVQEYCTEEISARAITLKEDCDIFAAVAKEIIAHGGLVCGAKFSDDFMNVSHAWASDEDGLRALQRSKPLQSDIGQTYAEAEGYLKEGKLVLYAGTPCQIVGLYEYLGKKYKKYNKLYTIDFVCGGIATADAYRSYAREVVGERALADVELGIAREDGNLVNVFTLKDGTRIEDPWNGKWLDGLRNGVTGCEACHSCACASCGIANLTLANCVMPEKQGAEFVGAKVLRVNGRKGEQLLRMIDEQIEHEDTISVERLDQMISKSALPAKPNPTAKFFYSHLHLGYSNALWYGKGMRYDVGLVGWWFASNYGSSLTYYALASILSDMGKQPLFIPIPKVNGTPWEPETKQTIDFLAKRFKIGKNRDFSHMREFNDFCDSFMVGSDQMWTPSATNLVGYTFFLDFADLNKKKIAFSTSFGRNTFAASEEMRSTVSDYLHRFDAISVREHSGIEVCKNSFGLDVEQVLDPVFLCKRERYEDMLEGIHHDVPEKYLLCYVLDPTPEKEAAARYIAEKLQLKIITILGMKEYSWTKDQWHTGEVLPKVTTEEFLYYIKNCSYMMTDSHHGVCMGIIFEREYTALVNESRGSTRFEAVAQSLGLESRLLYDPADIENQERLFEPIDYARVKKNLAPEQKRAEDWLLEAFRKETPYAEETVNTLRAKCQALQHDLTNNAALLHHKDEELKRRNQAPAPAAPNFDFVKIHILATLLRDYGIKHIVLSPGGRDVPIIRMFERNEKHFILHRVTDERSAAYYALGLAAQLKAPVACVCTSGTAASNYLPAVTEAYYTGIPMIVITADRFSAYLNHGEDQTIPQKDIYNGVVKMSTSLPEKGGYPAEYQTRRDIAACILEATHNGWGPVHINVPIQDISVGANWPQEKWDLMPYIYPHILRVGFENGQEEMKKWVEALKKSRRILIVYGQTPPLNEEQKRDVERFASKYNCVITTDTISNFDSPYAIDTYNLLSSISQDEFNQTLSPDIVISVGGKRLMNDPLTFKLRSGSNIRHWSVTPDGKIRDFYFKLSSVIECTQHQFFKWFADQAGRSTNDKTYLKTWKKMYDAHSVRPIEGFNSHYIQEKFIPAVPSNSMLHLGVGQSFFFVRRYRMQPNVEVFCNMGTNGIDGCTSTFMGQCAVEKERLCFLLVGDLSFFYDMNSIWNKQPGKNVRILLVNNNGSGLLRNHNLRAVTSVHNTKAEGWVRSTAFEYMSASSQEEFDRKLPYFMSDKSDSPLFFEVFCN